jgi:hypothetical protein
MVLDSRLRGSDKKSRDNKGLDTGKGGLPDPRRRAVMLPGEARKLED